MWEEVERWLDPDVTWRGVRDAAVCRNRDEVLEMLQGSLEGRLGADAVEVIAGEGAAVPGAKVPGLAAIGGVDVQGQLFNVFPVGCGRIVAVEDYARREEALAAAGATHAPSALVRSGPLNAVVMIDSAAGDSRAAPRP